MGCLPRFKSRLSKNPGWRKRRKVEGMRVFKYVAVFSLLLLPTSLCFARSGELIDIQVFPDPLTHCHQYFVDVALSKNSALEVNGAPECISDRPTFYGSPSVTFTNKFNRAMLAWKYAPQGLFKDGYFVDPQIGVETDEFKTAAGSSANVRFIIIGVHLGYQWFWSNGFNMSAGLGLGHLMRDSLEQSISATESSNGVDFLDQQTRTNTHPGVLWYMGWAF